MAAKMLQVQEYEVFPCMYKTAQSRLLAQEKKQIFMRPYAMFD